jgi:hypothetical protein
MNALHLADARMAGVVRERLRDLLHSSDTVTRMREAVVRLMSDLSEANALLPTAEECMAPTLRSVPSFDPIEVDVDWSDDAAPPTSRDCALAQEYGP